MIYNAICQRCGFRYKNYQLFEEPITQLKVCEECLDPRHPQDFVKARADGKPVPYIRPEPPEVSVGPSVNEDTQTSLPTGTFTTNNQTS